ncbi:MAG: EAL domain-containing protein, partial [Pseudomonadota bacterium]
VPADQIIDAARESFNIPKLDRWVTRQACKTAAQWTASGIAFESLSVNLCAETLLDPTFHGWFSECLKEENIDSKLIDFEIVESSFFTNIDVAIKAIYKLRRLGVTFSLDDFGTGFSSLSYLRQLPIDKIKIDRSFIDGVEREPDSAAMCASIVSVSHELGLRVIAEGIETELQLVTLRALRCDEVQGYFLSRPLPLTKATQFLLEHQAMPKHIKAG